MVRAAADGVGGRGDGAVGGDGRAAAQMAGDAARSLPHLRAVDRVGTGRAHVSGFDVLDLVSRGVEAFGFYFAGKNGRVDEGDGDIPAGTADFDVVAVFEPNGVVFADGDRSIAVGPQVPLAGLSPRGRIEPDRDNAAGDFGSDAVRADKLDVRRHALSERDRVGGRHSGIAEGEPVSRGSACGGDLFELRDVDRVGIVGAGRDVGDLAGDLFVRRSRRAGNDAADGNGGSRGFPYAVRIAAVVRAGNVVTDVPFAARSHGTFSQSHAALHRDSRVAAERHRSGDVGLVQIDVLFIFIFIP